MPGGNLASQAIRVPPKAVERTRTDSKSTLHDWCTSPVGVRCMDYGGANPPFVTMHPCKMPINVSSERRGGNLGIIWGTCGTCSSPAAAHWPVRHSPASLDEFAGHAPCYINSSVAKKTQLRQSRETVPATYTDATSTAVKLGLVKPAPGI